MTPNLFWVQLNGNDSQDSQDSQQCLLCFAGNIARRLKERNSIQFSLLLEQMVFGNLFPHRFEKIDYSKGLFYSGRIGFAPVSQSARKAPATSSILISPSSILKTADKKKSKFLSSRSFSGIKKLIFQTSSKIFIDTSIEESWNLEEYGGVKMWVNESTGEVSITNPKTEQSTTSSDRYQQLIETKDSHTVDGLNTAESSQYETGLTRVSIFSSDNEEVQEAFDILDPKFTFKQVILHQISPFK